MGNCYSKKKLGPNVELTHLSPAMIVKLRNAEYLHNSLSAGSKNRLKQYRENLAKSKGVRMPERDLELVPLIQKYAWNPNAIQDELSYLENLKDKDGYEFSRNLKVYSTIEDAMLRFAEKDYTSFRWNINYQKALKWLSNEFKSWKLKPIEFSCDGDILETLPKVDTHSGYYWILSGKKYKGENMEGAFEVWKDQVHEALESGTLNKPILLGFRTQASGEYEDNGSRTDTCKHKLRVVSMIDLIQIITELQFSAPFQQKLASYDGYAGGKDTRSISSIIHNWERRNVVFHSIDYSSFDQTISSWLIEDVFNVIKSCFILNEEQEGMWNVMVHDFIHKDFILNEGVLHSDKGVPSGSMWTQIIDTLVNLVAVRTYFNSINKDCSMIAMGDDNVIFTRASVTMEELASYIGKNFGLIIKVDDKSNSGRCMLDTVKFLSRYWRLGGEWRHPYHLLSRLVYPERHRRYSKEVGPQHVLYAFCLTYKLGMEQLIDVAKFQNDFNLIPSDIERVDSRYLPGSLAYIQEYTYGNRRKKKVA